MSIPLPSTDGAACAAEILRALHARGHTPRLLGFGEPVHGPEEFGRLRNGLFAHLVEHAGFRTIALESCCWAGRVADAWVRGGAGRIDDVLDGGFTHGFGALAANRELLEWAREHNGGRPPADQVRVTGFDGPLETMYAQSPRATLAHLHGVLAGHGVPVGPWARLDELLGDDGPWTDPAAAMDPTRSVGSEPRVVELRALADDLGRALTCATPALVGAIGRDAVDQAALAARTASALLSYHAAMSDGGDPDLRWSRCSDLRDAMMADNLCALAARGPTLAFAHTMHLRVGAARMAMGPIDVRWQPAGAHLADRLGRDYAVVGTAIGRADGLDDPAPDTVEGALGELPAGNHVLDARDVPRGHPARVTSHPGYFPLDDATLDQLDAVLFVDYLQDDMRWPR